MRDQDFAALGEHVQDAATPPGFEVLERRGQRLRRQRAGAVAVTVAVATAGVIVAVVGIGGPQDSAEPPVVSRSTAPSPTKSTSPPEDSDPTPEQIVADPRAYVSKLAASPSDPAVKAAIWHLCARDCNQERFALTVTDDDFATSTVVPMPKPGYPYLQSVGDDTFYLGGGKDPGQLVEGDGTVTPVTIDDAVRPLADGETLIHAEFNLASRPYLGLDPRTATAHPIDTEAGDLQQDLDGRLWGVDFRSLVVSTDGGRTWTEHPLNTATNRPILSLIPSAVGGTLAVAEGADGATLFPFIQIHRSTDGGATWEIVQESTETLTAYMEWAVVRPDGSLLVNLQNWSDDEAGNPSDRPHGLYESQGDAWADLAPVDTTVPGIKDPHAGWGWTASLLTTTVDAAGRQTLYVRDVEQRVFASTDGGRTWHAVAAR